MEKNRKFITGLMLIGTLLIGSGMLLGPAILIIF